MKKKYFTKGILLLLLFVVCIIVIRSPLLAVSQISVQGNEALNKEQICDIADIKEPVNIFAIKTDYLQNRLESDLRIEKATVRRIFPHTLSIEIHERHPIVALHCDYGYVNIDPNGVVMDSYKNLQSVKYPIITGVALDNVYIGDKISNDNILKAAQYLAAIDSDALWSLTEINVSDPQSITASTVTGVKIKLGDLSHIEDNAGKTVLFLHDLKTMKRPVEYIDFSNISPVIKFRF